MRGGWLTVVGIGLLLLTPSWASDADSAEASGKTEKQAVVIWKDLGVTQTRDFRSPTVAEMHSGDIVRVLGPRWKRMFQVEARGVKGWVSGADVVVLHGPHADARLLVAARNIEAPKYWFDPPNYGAAIALYSRLVESFPRSPYRPLALYRIARCAEKVAAEETRTVQEEWVARSEEWTAQPPGTRSDPAPSEREELRELAKWGVNFRLHHFGGHYYYLGDAYRTILREHGKSAWADEAAFALLKVRLGEWEGHPEGPLEELDQWIEFTKKYPQSDLLAQALLEQVYLNRVLYEIYSWPPGQPPGQFTHEQKASERRSAAENLCRRIVREFPATEFVAKAEDALAELAEGRNVYQFPDRFGRGG